MESIQEVNEKHGATTRVLALGRLPSSEASSVSYPAPGFDDYESASAGEGSPWSPRSKRGFNLTKSISGSLKKAASSPLKLLSQSFGDDFTKLESLISAHTMDSVDFNNMRPLEKVKTPKSQTQLRPFLTYEALVWILYGAVTILAIADRFKWNIWPRQSFTPDWFIKEGGTAGGDRTEGYKPGPWSVVAYDILARVSGRFSIVCFNLLLIVRLRSLAHYLTTARWVQHVVDTSDLVNANLRLHVWNGIGLCVLTLLHVFSILLPCVTHKYGVQVIPGVFEYPLSERTPKGFKDADPETKMMSLQADDVFRMVEMSLFLGVLMPLSARWLARKWHAGIHLHNFIMLVYFVDIVRRHSHPHSWVLNTPVFLVYLIDMVWARFFWRRNRPSKVHREVLSADYMVLYYDHPVGNMDTVGPDYFLRLDRSSCWERAHVFTSFENRSGLPLARDGSGFKDWSVATVIRVFHQKRSPQLGRLEDVSHTHRMYATPAEDLRLTAWGPQQGEMSEMVRDALLGEAMAVAIVAAGSGVNVLIDALQRERSADHASARCPLTLVFTTRDEALFRWVVEVVNTLNPSNNPNVTVLLAITGKAVGRIVQRPPRYVADCAKIIKGRCNFFTDLPAGAKVFCQGSEKLKEKVAEACLELNCEYHGGIGGGASAAAQRPTVKDHPSVGVAAEEGLELEDNVVYLRMDEEGIPREISDDSQDSDIEWSKSVAHTTAAAPFQAFRRFSRRGSASVGERVAHILKTVSRRSSAASNVGAPRGQGLEQPVHETHSSSIHGKGLLPTLSDLSSGGSNKRPGGRRTSYGQQQLGLRRANPLKHALRPTATTSRSASSNLALRLAATSDSASGPHPEEDHHRRPSMVAVPSSAHSASLLPRTQSKILGVHSPQPAMPNVSEDHEFEL